jgi:hypothetical protein
MLQVNQRLPRANHLQQFILPLSDSTQSTKFDATTKLILGSKWFNPSDLCWRLRPETIATFAMLLGTTNNADAAGADLYFVPDIGSPSVIATLATTTSLVATRLTADVSAYFRPGAAAGRFSARCWITTANGSDNATSYGSSIEVKP